MKNGKFATRVDLVNSYDNLQRAFTRKCQLVKQLSKLLSDANIEVPTHKDEQLRADRLFEQDNNDKMQLSVDRLIEQCIANKVDLSKQDSSNNADFTKQNSKNNEQLRQNNTSAELNINIDNVENDDTIICNNAQNNADIVGNNAQNNTILGSNDNFTADCDNDNASNCKIDDCQVVKNKFAEQMITPLVDEQSSKLTEVDNISGTSTLPPQEMDKQTFYAKYPLATLFRQLIEALLDNPDVSSCNDRKEALLNVCCDKTLLYHALADEQDFCDFIYSNAQIKRKILADYLLALQNNRVVPTIKTGAKLPLCPPTRPTTLQQASKMVKHYIG